MLQNMKHEFLQIAIDGPAGAGKSTVAKKVAETLNFCYLDTGAMYRAIAYKALHNGIDIHDEEAVTQVAQNTEIRFGHEGRESVYCDGKDVTMQIRSTEVSRAVSVVASYEGVRRRLVELQRLEAAQNNVIMDGRDIGTYVLPNARIKIFLTASNEERARRRYLEIQQSGKQLTLEEVSQDIQNRDKMDTERTVSPLKAAEDAIILDTSGLTIEEVVKKIVNIAREAQGELL